MRKRVLAMGMLIGVLLMVVAGCGSVRTKNVLLEDLLLPVDSASLPILPEEVVIERFERHAEKYAALAEAVEKRAPEWEWEPLARRLDEYGFPVTFPLVTSLPRPRIVCRLRGDAETFDQSIRYTKDPHALSAMGLYDTADLVRSTRDLGNGWYYCLDIRSELKYRDRYIAAAADWLEAQGYDRAKMEAGEWMVSLQSRDRAMVMTRPADDSGQVQSDWLAVVRFQPMQTAEEWIQCPDVILLPLSCQVVAYSGNSDPDIRPEDLLDPEAVDPPNQLETDVLSYFSDKRKTFEEVAAYLLAHEKEIGSRPVYLRRGWEKLFDRLPDERIRSLAIELVEIGPVAGIESLNDGPWHYVAFFVEVVPGRYESGIWYGTLPPGVIREGESYNTMIQETDLGEGWAAFSHRRTEIRHSDWYRKRVWDLLVSSRKTMLYDWRMAEVELVDANDVSYVSLIQNEKPYDGPLVAVTFRTVDDSILGPKRAYVRPDTLEIVGLARRM